LHDALSANALSADDAPSADDTPRRREVPRTDA
jgi:hypothetical protein